MIKQENLSFTDSNVINQKDVIMKNITVLLLLLLYSSFSFAEKNRSLDHLTFGIVPQQSASKLAQLWGPIINEINKQSGLNIHFATAPNIPIFEARLAAGEYDIAYMNPYHYTVFHQKSGYQALAKARDKRIKGIIVVAKDSKVNSLLELKNSTLAFPAPAAFAATILTQADLSAQHVNFTPKYVSSHDSVYRSVAKGIYPAGGGIVRTFRNIDENIRKQLKILWTTNGYTPHAIATHPRIPPEMAKKIQRILIKMGEQTKGKQLLHSIKIKSFEEAINSDWDDVRKLKLNQLADS